MHVIFLVPINLRPEFSEFVDNSLSRELDWNLVRVILHEFRTALDQDVLDRSLSPLNALAELLPYGAEFYPRSFSCLLYGLLERPYDVWAFAPSPVNLLEDIDSVIELAQSLGCVIGVTPFALERV